MDRFKQQVDQLHQQLAGLTLSQKMLTGTLVAIMVATVVWWAYYAATDEMVALFDSTIPQEQLGAVQAGLSMRGIPHAVQGDRILVPANQRDAAISLLAWDKHLPRDLSSPLGEAIDKMGPFDRPQKVNMIEKEATAKTLEQILRSMRGVRSANVAINLGDRRQIGREQLPGASVTIESTGSEDPAQIAAAATRLMSAYLPVLKPERLAVSVDGRFFDRAEESNATGSSAQHTRERVEAERAYEEKVRRALPPIPQLAVTVAAEVDGPIWPQEPVGALVQTLEPGVITNAGDSLNQLAQKSNHDSPPHGQTENQTVEGTTRQEIPRGSVPPRPVSCSLTLPMHWVVESWKGAFHRNEEPDPTMLAQYKEQLLPELRKLVSHALGGLDDQKITIFVDSSSGVGLSVSAVGKMEPTAGISALIRDYGKEVAVAALAAVSLFLVSTMVKKTSALAPPASSVFDGQSVALYGGGIAGISGEADKLLMVKDLGEEAGHAGHVLEQVQMLVKENPDAAAALVKRWLNAA